MKRLSTVAIALLVLGTLGCAAEESSPDEEAFRQAVPSLASLSANVPGEAATESEADADVGGARAELIGERAVMHGATRDVADEYNGWIAHVFDVLDNIMEESPSAIGPTSATWGPWSYPLNPLTWRFDMSRGSGNHFSYTLSAKARSASDAAYQAILTGSTEIDGRTGLSHGSFVVDYTALYTIDPAESDGTTGQAWVVYDERTEPSEVVFSYSDPVTGAWLSYAHGSYSDGSGYLDYRGAGWEESEAFWMVSAWDEVGRGRSDLYQTLDELPEGSYVLSECWDHSFGRTFYDDGYTAEGDEMACEFPFLLE